MPVTTTPMPDRVNTRSTARRKRPSALRSPDARASSTRRWRSASMPRPVVEDTGRMSTPSSRVPAVASRICACTSASRSGVARSAFVSAIRPRSMCSRSRIARCSSVCGMTPSSAATTSRAMSMPLAPAAIVCTKRSWPGTSMKPSVKSSSSGRYAKPRSMVMPRAFSSFSRSPSTPVSALTSDVLPWSICPAVPTIMDAVRRVGCCRDGRVIPATAFRPPRRGNAGRAATHHRRCGR